MFQRFQVNISITIQLLQLTKFLYNNFNRGEEYVAHIKCITEEERYAAKGSMPNGVVKKGEVKQQTWTDMIRSIIEKEVNLSVGLRNMLNIVGGYVNVPRKKVKFIVSIFISNIL